MHLNNSGSEEVSRGPETSKRSERIRLVFAHPLAQLIGAPLRYFTILDACLSGENRQTHTKLWGFSMCGVLPTADRNRGEVP